MKTCTLCKKSKNESEFYIKTKEPLKYHSRCKICQSKYNKKHYIENKDKYKTKAKTNNKIYKDKNRDYFNKLKQSKGCYFCNEDTPCCLDFHHLDPDKKENQVARMISSSLSISKIKKEISKCIVVCSNCHRKLHNGILKI